MELPEFPKLLSSFPFGGFQLGAAALQIVKHRIGRMKGTEKADLLFCLFLGDAEMRLKGFIFDHHAVFLREPPELYASCIALAASMAKTPKNTPTKKENAKFSESQRKAFRICG